MKAIRLSSILLLIAALTACGSNGGGSNSQTNGSSGSTPTVSSIGISPTSSALGMGATQQFKATAFMSNGTSQDVTSTVQWGSSNTTVAGISAAGLATASGAGSTTITAQSGKLNATANLTVTQAAANLTSIVISPASPSMPVNTSQQFTATGNYTDGSSADLTNVVTWSSTSTANATVTASGLVTAVAAGTARIGASLGAVSQLTTVTVTAPTVVSITVTPDGQTLGIGINQQYVATATYSDGSSSDLSSGVTWNSSSTSVATVSNTGLVTTVAAGQTTITATLGALSDNSTLTVVQAQLTSITVSPATQSIAAGTQQQFTAIGNFDDGSFQLLTSVTWSSSSNSVATVDVNGNATGVAAGQTTITATSGSVSGTASLTVTAATVVSIAVTPANSSMASSTTKQFAATATFSDSSTQDVSASVLWTSSSPAVATINAQGQVSALAAGSTTIKAVYGTVSGTTTLTVSTARLVSIAISPVNPRIEKGTTIKFTATGTFSDSSTSTQLSGLSWKSSRPNLASIRSTGIAHGKKNGSVTISASASGVTGTTTLTIGSGTLVSLAVTPATATCSVGSAQLFAAIGTFSDSSTQDITLNSHWSSSSGPVATIANAPSVAGQANCQGAGTAIIGANSGGITGSATLTVQ